MPVGHQVARPYFAAHQNLRVLLIQLQKVLYVGVRPQVPQTVEGPLL